jgi:hypothetical protein
VELLQTPVARENVREIMPSEKQGQRQSVLKVPPELTEEEGHVWTVMTDDRGRKRYITLGETVLERMGQPRPSPHHRVFHRNGNKLDNRCENLEWRLPTISAEPAVN